jgi:DNA polymerase-4
MVSTQTEMNNNPINRLCRDCLHLDQSKDDAGTHDAGQAHEQSADRAARMQPATQQPATQQPENQQQRCPACQSTRLIGHRELTSASLAHIDCDAFFAAIEKRDDPSLRAKPVIIGGGRRGVVSTACYIARIHGVRSAMPMFKALRACPEAVVIRPDIEKYATVGRQVRQAMQALTPLVEPLSIDEAFLDLSGTRAIHGGPPARTLARFALDVEREIGITVSIGLANNKFMAKIASDLDKPRGFTILGAAETMEFLADKPLTIIPGIGPAFANRLARDGYRKMSDVQRVDESRLATLHGESGLRLHRLARGIDPRKVDPSSERKSVSSETTFDEDISDPETLRALLWRLSEKVSARLKVAELAGHTITLKLKTPDFQTRTRATKLTDPTRYADRIFASGDNLLEREADGTAFRLLGIGVSDLTGLDRADPGHLLDPEPGRRAAAEDAMDGVRARFGEDAILRGLSLKAPRRRTHQNTQQSPHQSTHGTGRSDQKSDE